MASKILRKLTIRDAFGGKADLLKAAQSGRTVSKDENGKDVFSTTGEPVNILQIMGEVHGFNPGEGDHGSFLKLKGAFEATNLVTGEVVADVGTAILPNFISDLVANAMQGGAEAVQFAIVISVRYDEAAATMYVFEAKSLMPVKEASAISAIKAQLAQAGVALPAPAVLKVLEAPKAAPVETAVEAAKPAAKAAKK